MIQQTATRKQTQFRRDPQTQILQRQSIDQHIQPPLMIDDQQPDDIGHLISEDINNIDHSSVHNVIVSHSLNQPSQDQEDHQISKYQAFFEFLIV